MSTLSFTLKAETAAARAQILETVNVIKGLGDAARKSATEAKTSAQEIAQAYARAGGQVSAEFSGGFKPAVNSASVFVEAAEAERAREAYADLEAAIDPAIRAQRQFEAQQELVNRALAFGVVSQDEAARSLQTLSARYDELRRAASAGPGTNAASDSAAVFIEAERAQSAYRGLLAAIDPVTRAQQQFEAQQTVVNRALQLGVVSQDEAARSLQLLSARFDEVRNASRGVDVAGHSVANLGYQFNDIAMMWAAGQNPLMTAIQQGSQIGQVLGPMGAGGAVKALGSAFIGLLNPVNLAVMAIIAGGGAIVQWMAASEAEVRTLEDAVGELQDAVSTYAREAGKDLDALRQDFGEVTPEIERLHAAMVDLAEAKALIGILDTVKSLKAEMAGGWFRSELTDVAELLDKPQSVPMTEEYRRGLAAQRGLDPELIRGAMPNAEVVQFQQQLDALANARGLTAQIEAADRLKVSFDQATGGIEKMTASQLAFYGQLLAARGEMERFRAVQTAAARDADTDLDTLRRKADLNRLILQYGEDSAVVTAERVKAEREIFVAQTKARDVSEEMKQQLIEAWDAANDLAGVDLRANIAAAIGPASRLGELLRQAAGWWQQARSGMAAAENQAGAAVGSGPAGTPQVPSGLGNVSLVPGFNPYDPDAAPRTSPPPPPERPFDLGAGDDGGSGGGSGGGRASAAPASLTDLRAEMRDLLSDLDLQAAQIAEKVRLGLMTSAEGSAALAQARREAAEGIADLIPQIEAQNQAAGPEAAAAVEKARLAVQGLAGDWKAAGKGLGDVGKDMSRTFADAFGGFLAGAASAEDAMASLENAVTSAIARMFSQRLEQQIFTPFFGPMLDSIFSFLPFAQGGVPDAPGLEAYSGTVGDEPIAFRMASGDLGIAREAGPEAILPVTDGGIRARAPDGAEVTVGLRRMADGVLGVALPEMVANPAEAEPRQDAPMGPAMLTAPPATSAPPAVISGAAPTATETPLARLAREAAELVPQPAVTPGATPATPETPLAITPGAAPAAVETAVDRLAGEVPAVLAPPAAIPGAGRVATQTPQAPEVSAPAATAIPAVAPAAPETPLARLMRKLAEVMAPPEALAQPIEADVRQSGPVVQPELARRPAVADPFQQAARVRDLIQALRQPLRDISGAARRMAHPDLDHEAIDATYRAGGGGGRVVEGPEAFGLANGRVGVVGEAGPEAILPLRNGQVGAVGPDGAQMALPLKRLSDGALGVQLPSWRPAALNAPVLPFAKGGVISGGSVLEPDGAAVPAAGSVARSPAAGVAAAVAEAIQKMPAPQVNVKIDNRAADAVKVNQSSRQDSSGTMFNVVIERIKGEIMNDVARGGMVSDALQQAYGLQRQVR